MPAAPAGEACGPGSGLQAADPCSGVPGRRCTANHGIQAFSHGDLCADRGAERDLAAHDWPRPSTGCGAFLGWVDRGDLPGSALPGCPARAAVVPQRTPVRQNWSWGTPEPLRGRGRGAAGGCVRVTVSRGSGWVSDPREGLSVAPPVSRPIMIGGETGCREPRAYDH